MRYRIIRENTAAILASGRILAGYDDTLLVLEREACSISYVNPFVLADPVIADLAAEAHHYFVVDSVFTRAVVNLLLHRNAKVDVQNFDFSGIADRVLKRCASQGLDLVVCGARSYQLERFHEILIARHPKLHIKGLFDGYDPECYESELADYARRPGTLILLGLGSPKQEHFVRKLHRQGGFACQLFTCGGFIGQVSSTAHGNYYPWVFRKFGIRFVYRFWKEPKTISRVLRCYPSFLLAAVSFWRGRH